jgi:cell division septum initiation protein DivIVA
MNQQISVDAALDAFRREYGQVADANVLLKARVAELEAEVERLHASASGATTEVVEEHTEARYPSMGG